MNKTTTEPWLPYKLHDLGFVGRGKSRHRPRNDKSLYGGEYPFFQTGDVKAAGFKMRRYKQTYNEIGLAQSKLWQPGTLCITIAANIADTAILDVPGCFPDSIVGFVADEKKSDVRFVKYAIDLLKLQMRNISRGTTQDNLSVDKLLLFDIMAPNPAIQRDIADRLSSYDELIEYNSKRIEMLEAMARLLYQKMFVKVENTGWPKKAVNDLIKRVSPGKLYAQKNVLAEGNVPVFDQGLSGVIGYHNNEPGVVASYEYPIVTFANHTCYQRLVFHPFSAIQNVLPFLPIDEHDIYWLHFATKDLVKLNDYKGHWPEFMSKTITVPDIELSKEFGEKVKPSLVLIDKLEQKNKKLVEARDLLLPRLMFGDIKI